MKRFWLDLISKILKTRINISQKFSKFMIDLSESRIYEFEEFRLEAKNHRLFLRETDELVPLTPKAVEVLLYLVENVGRIISKDEILEAVWENAFVEESNLSQTIFVLRKTLGEDTKKTAIYSDSAESWISIYRICQKNKYI